MVSQDPAPSSEVGPSGAAPSPLEGLVVIDASTIVAGPLCCQVLGDYGADVVKIEHPRHGDSMRGHGPQKDGVPLWWKEISRNKRTVGLDLSQSDGAAVFRRLAATADVVVENFRPGTFERWGLDPGTLHADNPGLVLLRLTGFGQHGPYSRRPGFGTLAEAMSGFAHLTGEADGPPTLPSFGLADSICGLAGSTAVLTALRHRDATGEGQVIDLDIWGPITTAVGPAPLEYAALGTVPARHGNRSTNNAPRNTYRTRDGRWVAVSTSAQRIAEKVMTLVGHPEVIGLPWFATGRERAEHADELDAMVGAWIAERDRDEVLDTFAEAGAAVGPVYDARDIVEDPHVRATEMLTEVDDDDLGPMLMHNVMWRMSRTPGRIRHTGRAPGADTDTVLADAGLDTESIAALREKGVVR